MPENAVTFTAQWKDKAQEQPEKPVKYTVTYDLNGGTGTLPTETDKAKGEKFNLAKADGLTNGDKEFDGWSDGANKYDAGAEYTMPENAVTFTAQWKDKAQEQPEQPIYTAYELDYKGTILLYADNTGMLDYYSEADDSNYEVKLTYTLSGTSIAITIGGSTFNGTYDGKLLAVQIIYASTVFKFGAAQEQPIGKPQILFSANGGTGSAPVIADEDIKYNDKSGLYQFKLPLNTYTAPEGKVFKGWNINDKKDANGNLVVDKVNTTYMADPGEKLTIKPLWDDAAPPAISGIEFYGSCTLPEKKGLFGSVSGGETVVKIIIDNADLQSLTVYYNLINDDKDYKVTGVRAANLNNLEENPYGDGAKYYGECRIGALGYYFVVNSDFTKLYLCNSDDELLENGEFTTTPPATPEYTVTYVKPNGVTGEIPQAVTIESGKQITLAAATQFAKAGWTFKGWAVTGYNALRAAETQITVAENTTVTPVFSIDYTGDIGKITVLDNGTVVNDGNTYSYTGNGDIIVIDYDGYMMAVKLNDTAKTYVAADGMNNFTFTAANNATLTFDGFGKATLGAAEGTYTLVNDGAAITLVFDGNTYSDIEFKGDYPDFTIEVTITIDGTEYVFGNSVINPPVEIPTPTGLISEYIGVNFGYASASDAGNNVIKASNTLGQEKTFFKASITKKFDSTIVVSIYYTSMASINTTTNSQGQSILVDDSTPNQIIHVASTSFEGVTFVVVLSKVNDTCVITITYGDTTVTWSEITA
ncbi:MAG: InlB B-repeat-containing protein [Clostridiales bacterium]|nr:InlB B-repeat-containing protein [Clostridiales bacterium]